MPFKELGLHSNILKGIELMGFSQPTPIQKEAIPHILAGRDLIASAQTGTGKTAAFVLPILHRLMNQDKTKNVRALVLAPTRELALQSTQQLEKLSTYVNLRGCAVFGGVPIDPQKRAIAQGVDIISATPGRLLDHIYQGHINFRDLKVLVLDEADRMMDMGFLPDIKRIVSLLPPTRQNLIFSATIPEEIMSLARTFVHDPVRIQISPKTTTAAGIRHAVYPVSHEQKTDLLLKILCSEDMRDSSVIIFVRTKHGADKLARTLQRTGITLGVIHGDRSQGQRLQALDRFKARKFQVLVATDVAARGIDVKDVSHVINFDVPHAPGDYIHRSGRTARVEATGDAFTLVTPEEEDFLKDIEQLINQRLPRVVLPDFPYRKAPMHFSRPAGDRHRPHGRKHFPPRGGQGRPQGSGGHPGRHERKHFAK
ncbi:MAG: hypothetical protein A3C47_05925 [Omnitrophica bacterium RIFCSPHIGHO2_02_FULL_51_18]|nr:MAG: hypothetical protein A3C47_05925 [Omnitrophica bacterium RIFCSPHIGHO2_02_FULL_51_18]